MIGKGGRGKKKLEIATDFITEYFGSKNEIASKEIELEAARRNIKRNTLLSAKKKLNIRSGRGMDEAGNQYWTWIKEE